MDIPQQLLAGRSLAHVKQLSVHIGGDKSKFDALMHCFLGDNPLLAQRAAHVMSWCCDAHPDLILPYLPDVIGLAKSDTSTALKRNGIRVLQNIDIPEEYQGLVAELCFDLLTARGESIAVKVFSMTVLSNICVGEPELSKELRMIIEDQMPYASPAFLSRARRILKRLQRGR